VFLAGIMGVYVAATRLGLQDVGIALVLTALACGLLAFIYRRKAAEVRPVLRNRNLVLVYVSAIAILWHLWFYGFWSVALVKEVGGSALTSAALVASFSGIAGLVGYPLGGWLSDRVAHVRNGRRNLLALLAAGLTVLVFVFAAYLASGRKDLVVMSIILFVSGLFSFAIQPVSHTVTVENAPAALRGSAFGMWNLVAEIGAVLSPVVSGALRDGTGSWTPPLLLDGVLMGASCLVILAIRAGAPAPQVLRLVQESGPIRGLGAQTSREIRAEPVDG
jgi:sugar phosphate permease